MSGINTSVKALHTQILRVSGLKGIPSGGLIRNIPAEKLLKDELWEKSWNATDKRCGEEWGG